MSFGDREFPVIGPSVGGQQGGKLEKAPDGSEMS
jgi:hypothetical protein